MERFEFPSWTNRLLPVLAVFVAAGGAYAIAVGAYATAPGTINVGYSPKQPVPFSHKTHAGMLKMDCRYCHTTVDKAAHAAVPPTQTCVNCHSAANPDGSVANAAIHTNSEKLLPIRESQATGAPVEWERVHDLPDFVYFNHSAHVNRGVSCVSCHGRIDKMEQVYQAEPLTMSWCLECHRNPEPHLRPQEFITQLDWEPSEPREVVGARIRDELNIHPSTNCSTCHR
ncbi:MAG: cytochrome c3 family protein [Pirellulales bacterium]|nr:cytochrome c3 family protein [Pirellulales bacterium]MBL7193315.1 cytochrome c3 family protein [Pirellulales bacterium]